MDVNRYFINKLTDDICCYLDWLQETMGYYISIHGVEHTSCSTWYRFLKYYYHLCPLCLEIKNATNAWRHCIERQPHVRQCLGKEPLLGTCYAGVSEYVFPLLDIHGQPLDKLCGFICVSGFTLDRANALERARAAATRYGLSHKRVEAAVNALNDKVPDRSVIISQIAPVQNMFAMLIHFSDLLYDSSDTSDPQKDLYMKIIREVNRSYRDPDFSLNTLCERFNVSYSHASHIFSRYNDVPFRQHLRRLRVETAKIYLEDSKVAITCLSAECGFDDSNYFSSTFRAETGMTPSQWREQHAGGQTSGSLLDDRPHGVTAPRNVWDNLNYNN